MRNRFFLASVVSIALFAFISCSKSSDQNGQTTLNIRMTDAPYNAQEVNIDLREIRVRLSDDTSSFIPLSTHAKVYNLLNFQNGIDTTIAIGTVPAGSTVREVRFILGPNNSIKIDSVTYPLTIPSGEESGLKIKVSKNLNASLDSLVFDFDANLSILQTGNGDYKLKPVIRLK